jgi:single-strand DNA-binding protein
MINDANIDLAGFVASEPSFKLLDNGTSTAKLRVAYTERRFNRETGEWGDGPTSFVTVLCWRTLADNVAVCLRKGEPVLVRGRLRVREYQDTEGRPRAVTEVDASSIGHDLSRGVAHFSRTRRAPGETAAENAEAQAGPPSPGGEQPAHPAGPDEPVRPDGPAGKRAAGQRAAGQRAAGKGAAGKGTAGQDGVGAGGADENGRGEHGADENSRGVDGAEENGAGVLNDEAVAQFASELSGSADAVGA